MSMTTETWTLAAPPLDYVLANVRAVLPDQVLDDARIVVRDGRIAAVERHTPGTAYDVDGQGLLALPGLVDTHSDGLENERLPRPGAELPTEFAMLSFEGKLRAAGVTTAYHGVSFTENPRRSLTRTVSGAEAMCATIDTYPGALVEHRILYRLDVRSPEGLAALKDRLDLVPDGALVSHEDHTPGQGQYANRAYYERWVKGRQGMTDGEAQEYTDKYVADRDSRLDVRAESLAWLGTRSARIRLLGHDPVSATEIDELVERGGAVAEFPTTLDAAQAARDHGLPVVMGAPNVLRGNSHNGNVSAGEAVRRGLVTGLASDYLPSGLLAAALMLAEQGVVDLPAAVALVTSGPAEVAGLSDRGRLAEGLRADLVLVEPRHPWPVVRSVLSMGGVR
ncbi:alpha-D-ribose 1-methylphosphonate 5-triphosphate diphosphatase [Actinoplanes sp. TBRC 11911]|nr:alpha-D-ribose 1-methylphosphonate 5-triphosphate diphosphatase [Actinoplanes sp. TBRC 11911]